MNYLGNALNPNNFTLVEDENDRFALGLPPMQRQEARPQFDFTQENQGGGPTTAGTLGAASQVAQASGASSPVQSALGMGATGATLGSAAGPPGAAIGAAIGTTAGLVGGLFGAQAEAEERKRQAKLEAAQVEFEGLQDALRTGSQQQGQAISTFDLGLQRALLGGR